VSSINAAVVRLQREAREADFRACGSRGGNALYGEDSTLDGEDGMREVSDAPLEEELRLERVRCVGGYGRVELSRGRSPCRLLELVVLMQRCLVRGGECLRTSCAPLSPLFLPGTVRFGG
jgi:hypothetical protein